jgi:hypothetical protein
MKIGNAIKNNVYLIYKVLKLWQSLSEIKLSIERPKQYDKIASGFLIFNI